MNPKVFLLTFSTILIAELFDKIELAIISLAIKERDKISVFWGGAIFAFFVATILAILLGDTINRFIGPEIIRYVSAGIFVITGIFIFLGKL